MTKPKKPEDKKFAKAHKKIDANLEEVADRVIRGKKPRRSIAVVVTGTHATPKEWHNSADRKSHERAWKGSQAEAEIKDPNDGETLTITTGKYTDNAMVRRARKAARYLNDTLKPKK